ncbi:hypothetical protein TL16_g10255 [Triparma laevis f. inornata]|uniref:Uncharacterized protein n=1 Tax=Triparma laevis f. inornata TaxID=1714386 RepID=A0A9W7BBG5_9STRA|nr:hypothetical protein TL16_g10255 [Triparma laevis f. inornata]
MPSPLLTRGTVTLIWRKMRSKELATLKPWYIFSSVGMWGILPCFNEGLMLRRAEGGAANAASVLELLGVLRL